MKKNGKNGTPSVSIRMQEHGFQRAGDLLRSKRTIVGRDASRWTELYTLFAYISRLVRVLARYSTNNIYIYIYIYIIQERTSDKMTRVIRVIRV
jgi:hypothetical protein